MAFSNNAVCSVSSLDSQSSLTLSIFEFRSDASNLVSEVLSFSCKISWDGLVETGYEPVKEAAPDEQVMAKAEYQAIRARMDKEDARIARAFELKELMGYTVEEIAEELGVSKPRVYQLIARAKAIGMAFREKNR